MSITRNHVILAALLLAACTTQHPLPDAGDTQPGISAEPWPEADRLFFNNPDTPQWKGADVANSVAVGDERVLWVFGDTLLAEPGANACDRFDEFGILVHNSLALQAGTDPTTARIAHYWREREGKPTSFFEPVRDDGSWYWMGGLTVLGDQALVFLMHARSTVDDSGAALNAGGDTACAGLNFAMLGWAARIATITTQTPDQWQWRDVALPRDAYWHRILVGSSTVLADDDYLYAWSAGPATLGGNPVYLARWPLADAAAANLAEPQWHTGDGWQLQSALGGEPPAAIVMDGNNEISVAEHVWPYATQPWWWLQSSQVMNSALCYRSGDTRVSFGECRAFMRPPELRHYPDSSLLVYAVKFHPALTGQGDGAAIATYVVNSCSLQDIQQKCDLYYPRFLRLRLRQ
jgi:hypothetical protein